MGLSQLEICNQALLKVGADTIDTLTEPTSTEDGTKRSIQLCNIFFDQAYEEVLRMYPWNSAKKRTTIYLSENDSYPSEVISSGSGESAFNSTFLYAGMDNDKPTYSADGSTDEPIIRWNGTRWGMVNAFGSTDYVNFQDTYLPPLSGWTNEGFSGDSPAPSLLYTVEFGYDRKASLPSDLIRLIDLYPSETQNNQGTSWVVEGGYILSDYDTLYLKYIAKPSDTTELDPLCTNAVICNLAMKLCTSLQLDDAWAKRINDELYGVILPQSRSIDTMENKELLLEESSWLLSRDYDYPVI